MYNRSKHITKSYLNMLLVPIFNYDFTHKNILLNLNSGFILLIKIADLNPLKNRFNLTVCYIEPIFITI